MDSKWIATYGKMLYIELGYGHFCWNLDETENLLRMKLDFGWKLAMKLDWFDINFGSCGFQDTWRDGRGLAGDDAPLAD